MIEAKIDIPDFRRQLRDLSQDMQRKVVRAATNAAAQAIKRAVVQEAPILKSPDKRREAGRLRRAIYVYRRKDRQEGVERYAVSFRKGRQAARHRSGNLDAFYGRFLEAGWIPRGPGKRLRGGTHRKALERSRSTRGKITLPFLRPGFQKAQQAALLAFNKRIEARIAKANAAR